MKKPNGAERTISPRHCAPRATPAGFPLKSKCAIPGTALPSTTRRWSGQMTHCRSPSRNREEVFWSLPSAIQRRGRSSALHAARPTRRQSGALSGVTAAGAATASRSRGRWLLPVSVRRRERPVSAGIWPSATTTGTTPSACRNSKATRSPSSSSPDWWTGKRPPNGAN